MPVFRELRADLPWALTWAVGVAVGVATGAWLTAVGSAGAPGAASLDVARELVVTPAVSGLAVVALYLAAAFGIRALRRSTGS